jgi:hypothetical protein
MPLAVVATLPKELKLNYLYALMKAVLMAGLEPAADCSAFTLPPHEKPIWVADRYLEW